MPLIAEAMRGGRRSARRRSSPSTCRRSRASGSGAGFEFQLLDTQGRTAAELAATARGLAFAANQDPAAAGVYTTFSAESPQLFLDIDRDRL
jgi:multidrug efflux pump subunit AcrB